MFGIAANLGYGQSVLIAVGSDVYGRQQRLTRDEATCWQANA